MKEYGVALGGIISGIRCGNIAIDDLINEHNVPNSSILRLKKRRAYEEQQIYKDIKNNNINTEPRIKYRFTNNLVLSDSLFDRSNNIKISNINSCSEKSSNI